MVQTASADFVVVGMNTSTPTFYWRGKLLQEVRGLVAHVDEDSDHIKLRVLNTSNFDMEYLEMAESGISIKKVN